uniref:Phospholipase A2 n=1 Tax=Pelusios castaneus TaxID=367368 RepID=A0A8C8S7P4_9SAUR
MTPVGEDLERCQLTSLYGISPLYLLDRALTHCDNESRAPEVRTCLSILSAAAQGSLLEFRKMINQVTSKSAIMSYYGYGCYCGANGRGEPKDATDWCCRAHHCCYKRLKPSSCYGKRQRYSYTFKDGNILCAMGSWCEEQVCDCDRSTALCLERNLKTFNSRYIRYRDSKCTGFTPSC